MRAIDLAKQFLRTCLANGPRLAKEVYAESRSVGRFSKRTLDEAKKNLGVQSNRKTVPGPWAWTLPQHRSEAVSNKGMYLVVMFVTPELAAKWLQQSGGNRDLDPLRVAAYEEAMRRGEWRLNAQGIIFDVNGNLTNGHHRLEAVVRSGVTVEFSVTFNQPLDARILEDGNRPMLPQHAFKREGVNNVSAIAVSVAKVFDCIENPVRKPACLTVLDVQRRLEQWKHPIAFALQACHTSHGVSLAVRTLIARASGHVDLDRLAEFASVFINKGCVLNGETDAAAVKFYGLCLRSNPKGRFDIATLYQKGVSCLRAFVHRQDLKFIQASTQDAYPVVEDYSRVGLWLRDKRGDDASAK